MGRLAMGTRAFGNSSGVEVNVFKDTPGPQSITAWKPEEGIGNACGIVEIQDFVVVFKT